MRISIGHQKGKDSQKTSQVNLGDSTIASAQQASEGISQSSPVQSMAHTKPHIELQHFSAPGQSLSLLHAAGHSVWLLKKKCGHRPFLTKIRADMSSLKSHSIPSPFKQLFFLFKTSISVTRFILPCPPRVDCRRIKCLTISWDVIERVRLGV